MPIVRIPLTQPIESRSASVSKDSRSVNCVFESRDQLRELVRRPGLVKCTEIYSVTPPAIKQGQGLFAFKNTLYSVVDNYITKINPSTYAKTSIGAISGTLKPVHATKDFLNQYVVLHNGTHVYYINSVNALHTATLPTTQSLVSGIVFLDNYVFVGTVDNRIYNCDLGDPTNWDALSYISFTQAADSLVGISKHLNYLVAFGQWSMQFYYDAGTYPGSPLAVAGSYTSEVGCASGDSIVQTDNTVVWIGTSKSYGKSVYLLDGTTPTRISTPHIDRYLEKSTLDKVSAYVYKYNGHPLYVMTLHDLNYTFVYDVSEKIWYQWTSYAQASSDQPDSGTWEETYFRPTYYAEVTNIPFLLDDDTSSIYRFDPYIYQDDGVPIYTRTVTDIEDNGTTKRKFYGRLEIVGDKVAGNMYVRHSGDDYNTWSSWRSVDLNATRSQMYQCGADRRRAWEFLCYDNVPLRIDAAEIEVEIGEIDPTQNVGGGRYRR